MSRSPNDGMSASRIDRFGIHDPRPKRRRVVWLALSARRATDPGRPCRRRRRSCGSRRSSAPRRRPTSSMSGSDSPDTAGARRAGHTRGSAATSRSLHAAGGSRRPGAIISGSVMCPRSTRARATSASLRADRPCRSRSGTSRSRCSRRSCGRRSRAASTSSATQPMTGRSRQPSVVSPTTAASPTATRAMIERPSPRIALGSSIDPRQQREKRRRRYRERPSRRRLPTCRESTSAAGRVRENTTPGRGM